MPTAPHDLRPECAENFERLTKLSEKFSSQSGEWNVVRWMAITTVPVLIAALWAIWSEQSKAATALARIETRMEYNNLSLK